MPDDDPMALVTDPLVGAPAPPGARSALQVMLDAVDEAVVLVQPRRDAHGAVTALVVAMANAAACAEIGRPLADLVGRQIFSFGTSVLATRSLATYLVALGEPESPAAHDRMPSNGPGPRLRIERHGDSLVCSWRSPAPTADAEVSDRFRLLAENASDVVYEVDLAGCFTWISPSIERVLGWIPEPLLGTPAVDLVAVEDIRRVAAQRIAVVEGGSAEAVECRFRLPGGVTRWMSVDAHALRSDLGDVVGAVVTLRDVETEVLTRQALERSERRLALLTEEATDVILQLDRDHRCTWVSGAVERIFGWPPSTVIGRMADAFVHPEDRHHLDGPRSNGLLEPTEMTFRFRCGDGTFRTVRGRTRPLQDDEGTLIGRIAVLSPLQLEPPEARDPGAIDEPERATMAR